MGREPESQGNRPENEPQRLRATEVEVEIFGQLYRVRGEVEEHYARDLAAYVNEKMKDISDRMGGATPVRVAVLAALNVSHELFELRKEQSVQHEREGEVIQKTRKILEMIEGQLEG